MYNSLLNVNIMQFDESVYKKISDRELQAACAAKDGLSIQETADRMSISPSTVKSYRSRIMAKLGCKNITESIVRLIKAGIL